MLSLITKTWDSLVAVAEVIYEVRKAKGYKGYYY